MMTIDKTTDSHISSLSQVGIFAKKYLWDSNPAFVQLLGLCPLLAISNNFASAFVLGITTIVVMILSMMLISLLRFLALPDIRLPVFVALISGMTLIAEFMLKAWTYPIYLSIGIFVPLIITNCIVLARAEAFASKNNVVSASLDALGTGGGFAISLLFIGSVRELLGTGQLFVGMNDVFSWWHWVLSLPISLNFLLAILPPGAFFTLALMVALKNYISQRPARS